MSRAGARRPAKRARPPRSSHHSVETRARLLAAARDLFVERGFPRVTVREICRDAGANVAAVSYHFGDKLGLYREVARQALDAIRETSDLSVKTPPGTSVEERLRHYVRTFLPRLAKPSDGAQWIGKLMNNKMVAPTPIATWIFTEAIVPRLLYLKTIVAELLDVEPTDPRVAQCVTSIQAQCLYYRPDPFKTAVAPGWAPTDDAAVAAIVDHVVRFSLAGIKAVRKGPSVRVKTRS